MTSRTQVSQHPFAVARVECRPHLAGRMALAQDVLTAVRNYVARVADCLSILPTSEQEARQAEIEIVDIAAFLEVSQHGRLGCSWFSNDVGCGRGDTADRQSPA